LVVSGLGLDLAIWDFDGESRLHFRVPVALVVVSAVGVVAALLNRQRRPWLAFWVTLTYSVVWGALLQAYQPFVGLLIILYHLGRNFSFRSEARAVTLVAIPWVINTYNAAEASGPSLPALIVTGAIWLAIGAITWLAGQAGYRSEKIFKLQAAKQAAESALALQQERLDLAREVHDIVAYSISAVMFQAAGARAVAGDADPRIRQVLGAIELTSTQAMRELRSLLALLLPGAVNSRPDGIATLDDLDLLLETTRRCGVSVRLVQDGDRTLLGSNVEHTAYRVLQESLANAMRHAGHGSEAKVKLEWGPTDLRLTVLTKAGAPRNAPHSWNSSGLGLEGLRERVAGVGGHFDAGPCGEGDFLVAADLPYRP
jgi:signal transduction histidine kinase